VEIVLDRAVDCNHSMVAGLESLLDRPQPTATPLGACFAIESVAMRAG
jgi:hypothetical protein